MGMATSVRTGHHEYSGSDLIAAARATLTGADEQWTGMREAVFAELARHEIPASAYLAQMKASRLWKAPIVTGIERAQGFYPAEAYHQDFALKNPNHGYIRQWDVPKIAALKRMYPALYRASFQRN